MILFLDFDGVLHPDAVYLRLNGEIELRAPGALFMWAPALVDALEAHPQIRIVLPDRADARPVGAGGET